MLTFRFTGADGCMTVPEVLTTGMVGKQVKLEFSSDWDDLEKTAVFFGGDTVRNVRNVDEIVEIPHEVLRCSLTPLFVGVYGISADGRMVIPTIRVQGPIIGAGADPSEDEQAQPTLPIWASIEQEISHLRKQFESMNGISAEQIRALDGMFRVCAYDGNADYDAAYAAFREAFGLTDSGENGDGGGANADGVSSINWTVTGASGTAYDEPDNGYVITTDTAHTAIDSKSHICAWPLIEGKTYAITITGAKNDANGTASYYGLYVSTLSTDPVKGQVTAVTDTVVKNLTAWDGVAAGASKSYSHTAGAGEYLLLRANTLGATKITAEVTA